jgi:4-amino-4-deoxychorismate lyase
LNSHSEQATVIVNGSLQDTVRVYDRGLNYGDGVFETILIRNGVPEFLREHLQRLERACKSLLLRWDESLFNRDLSLLLKQAAPLLRENSVLKIILTRGEGGRGYKVDLASVTTRILMLSPAPDYDFDPQAGVSVCICDTRLSINPGLAGLKHLACIENVMARNEWQDDTVVEGLMMDVTGHLVEGTMSNLFLLSNGRLKTPSLERCGVEGIVRNLVIERLAPGLSVDLEVCDLYIDDLINADSVFITNSLIGIWPVIALGCHHKTIDPLVFKLQLALEKLQGV